jgi:hypothetical protein
MLLESVLSVIRINNARFEGGSESSVFWNVTL